MHGQPGHTKSAGAVLMEQSDMDAVPALWGYHSEGERGTGRSIKPTHCDGR